MDGLFVWVILGLVVYMLFSRKSGMGGMGCCGGHHYHQSNGPAHQHHDSDGDNSASPRQDGKVIEMKKEDYKVLPSHDHRAHGESQ